MISTVTDNGHPSSANGEETIGISGMETAPAASDTEKNDGLLTREEVLRLSSVTIRQLHHRTSVHRFKTQAGDRDRLAYVRALTQLLQVYNGLLKDGELEELEKRIDALENEE